VSGLDRTRDTINLVAAAMDVLGLGEHAIFGEDLAMAARRRAGSFSPKTVVKIADQQGRDAEGHGLSPLASSAACISRRETVRLRTFD